MTWKKYLNAASDPSIVSNLRLECVALFEPIREVIGLTIEKQKPQNTVFLGAGALNDVPLLRLIENNTKSVFVDWIANISSYGLSQAIISQTPYGLECMVSTKSKNPKKFCRAYDVSDSNLENRYCLNYKSSPFNQCGSFAPGASVSLVHHDVTQKYSTLVGEKAESLFSQNQSLDKTLNELEKIVQETQLVEKSLPLASGLADLVVSSMVVSQFYFEPFGYICRRLNEQFFSLMGKIKNEHEKRLYALQDAIALRQLKAHFNEIKRIITKNGLALVITELCSKSDPTHEFQTFPYFLGDIFGQLSDGFKVDPNILDANRLTFNFSGPNGASIVIALPLRIG